MKSLKQIIYFAVILISFISCKNKTMETPHPEAMADTKGVSDSIHDAAASLHPAEDSLHYAEGRVIEATMNGFTIVTPKNDTVYICILNKNIGLKGGLLLGDTLDVTYTVTKDSLPINMVSTVKKVN